MKTTLLSILFIASFASFSFGQIEMNIGTSGDIQGTQVDYTTAGAEVVVDVHITNKTGVSKNLTIERVRINETPGWIDYLCWGPYGDVLNGLCYTPTTMSTNPWTTSSALPLAHDSVGTLNIHVDSILNDGCTVYKYNVKDGPTVIGFIDISVCRTASLEEFGPSLSVSVAPNPANSYFTVNTNDVAGTMVQVIDVLGNVVLKETIMGTSKTINTQNFRNGVYFIRVEADNQRTINRKLVVKH